MTFDYIAGFFDGEGSISINPKGIPRIVLYQLTKNESVLIAIREFLENNQIKSHFYRDKTPRSDTFKESLMSTVHISSIADCMEFMRIISPLLIVKKAKVDTIFAKVQARGWRTPESVEAKMAAAVNDYNEGMGAGPAARKNHVQWKNLRKRLVEMGIPIRLRGEAQKLGWDRMKSEHKKTAIEILRTNAHPRFDGKYIANELPTS